MNEETFFDERPETKRANYSCRTAASAPTTRCAGCVGRRRRGPRGMNEQQKRSSPRPRLQVAWTTCSSARTRAAAAASTSRTCSPSSSSEARFSRVPAEGFAIRLDDGGEKFMDDSSKGHERRVSASRRRAPRSRRSWASSKTDCPRPSRPARRPPGQRGRGGRQPSPTRPGTCSAASADVRRQED